MKFLVIIALAALATVQAQGGIGGGYQSSGQGYGNNAYNQGQSGFNRGGYSGGAIREGHNIGHQENDYDATVHHHSSSSHNIGGSVAEGHRGGHSGGFNNHASGVNNRGQEYQRGGYNGI